jgi:hypothetical protein
MQHIRTAVAGLLLSIALLAVAAGTVLAATTATPAKATAASTIEYALLYLRHHARVRGPEQILGPDHPDTKDARAQLTRWTAEADTKK